MSEAICEVSTCDRPVKDAHVCKECAKVYTRALAEVPFLIRELDVVITRQTQYAEQLKRGGGETPMPFAPPASDIREHLAATLASWSRLVTEEGL